VGLEDSAYTGLSRDMCRDVSQYVAVRCSVLHYYKSLVGSEDSTGTKNRYLASLMQKDTSRERHT